MWISCWDFTIKDNFSVVIIVTVIFQQYRYTNQSD